MVNAQPNWFERTFEQLKCDSSTGKWIGRIGGIWAGMEFFGTLIESYSAWMKPVKWALMAGGAFLGFFAGNWLGKVVLDDQVIPFVERQLTANDVPQSTALAVNTAPRAGQENFAQVLQDNGAMPRQPNSLVFGNVTSVAGIVPPAKLSPTVQVAALTDGAQAPKNPVQLNS